MARKENQILWRKRKTLEFTAFFEKKIIAFLAISYYNVLYKPIAQKAEWADYDRVSRS